MNSSCAVAVLGSDTPMAFALDSARFRSFWCNSMRKPGSKLRLIIRSPCTSRIRDEAKPPLLAELIPLAFVVTPNVPEAEILAGMEIASLTDMEEAARRIHRAGARHVVVKGGHLDRGLDEATDILCDGRAIHRLASPWIATRDTHGTGCTFSAAIATGLARGKDVPDAVAAAKRYITEAIRHAWRIGGGHGPTNHLAGGRGEG